MTSYLERDADRVRRCVPEGASVPDDSDDLFLLYAVLLRAKGHNTQQSDVHDAWSAWMTTREPSHGSIRPFDELDAKTQEEDRPFLLAIRRAAETSTTAGAGDP